mgnify:CR=1 FL=1
MKNMDRLSIFLIPIGVAINFIGAQIALLLKLPVFLDAIGTIALGALCGGLPGAIVGVVSNTINSITYPPYVWYGVISAIYAVLAAYLSRKKIFCSLWKSLAAALVFAVIGGTLNSIITWLLFGFDFSPDTTTIFAIPLHTVLGLPKFAAQMIAAIGMDIVDKLLSVLAVFFILRSMPNRFLTKLKLGEFYIKKG